MSPDDPTCERCGHPCPNRGVSRFCSRPCFEEWMRATRRPAPTTARRKRAYGRWYRMWDRCTNPENSHWPRYGGRGITVCAQWKDFDAYYADTGDAPKGMTLDRIDNNGPYAPWNVRWATPAQQRANQEYDPMRSKTHCKHGHEFTSKNTHIDGRGWRSCRACARAKVARQRAAKKAGV